MPALTDIPSICIIISKNLEYVCQRTETAAGPHETVLWNSGHERGEAKAASTNRGLYYLLNVAESSESERRLS